VALHRRQFLRLCGIAAVGTIAGCTDSSGDGGSQSPGGDGSPSPTDGGSPTPTDGESPRSTDDGNSTATGTSTGVSQQTRLTADNSASSDQFGWSVAVSDDGTTAIVGAVGEGGPDRVTTGMTETDRDRAGAAYVFEATEGSWSQQAKLTADDRDSDDAFGSSVAVSSDGSTAVIGAMDDEDPNGEGAGSAYVFAATDGSWSQQAKLTADDGDGGDEFGWSAAVSSDGTTAIVGAQSNEDSGGEGSAYVFAAADGSWSQQAKLTADDGDSGDQFGRSVTMSGDGTTALVGANLDGDPNGQYAGSVYVFATTGGSWSQQTKLVPDDGDSGDAFGSSVAVSSDGSTALVGASLDEDPNGDQAGSTYVFAAADGAWGQQAKLAAEDGTPGDRFGNAVAVSSDGTTAVVGARNEMDMNSRGVGSAYVFDADDGSWSQRTTLSLDGEGQRFGGSVAMSGDGTTALVGDWQQIVENAGISAGAAYVFGL